jgi:hypothetical protein
MICVRPKINAFGIPGKNLLILGANECGPGTDVSPKKTALAFIQNAPGASGTKAVDQILGDTEIGARTDFGFNFPPLALASPKAHCDLRSSKIKCLAF